VSANFACFYIKKKEQHQQTTQLLQNPHLLILVLLPKCTVWVCEWKILLKIKQKLSMFPLAYLVHIEQILSPSPRLHKRRTHKKNRGT